MENMINEPKKEYNREMHTAEHIINQTMVRMFGTERSFSNHIERRKSKCDYRFDRALSQEEIDKLENAINEVICRNLEIQENLVSREEAELKYNTSKLPPEAGNMVRIISIGDYDHCPCIGEHVSSTSEIGAIKIISSDFDSGTGVLRIRYKRTHTE